MSNETFLIQQNDSIKGLPNEIKVGKTEVEPEVFYGHPCHFDDWEFDFKSNIQFNVHWEICGETLIKRTKNDLLLQLRIRMQPDQSEI